MKYIRYAMLFVGMIIVQTNYAHVETPDFEKEFNDLISKSNLAVVHFVNYDVIPVGKEHATEARALTEQINDLKEDFADVSDDNEFVDVAFIAVDLRAIPDLADDYGIKDLSTIILFKDGKPFKRAGEVVKRTGIMSQEDLEYWILQYFEDFITKLRVYARNKRPIHKMTNYTYNPYELHYYYRPFSSTNWYRSYWQRPYYQKYRGRPYYWRHNGYGHGMASEGIGMYGHRGGIGYGFGW